MVDSTDEPRGSESPATPAQTTGGAGRNKDIDWVAAERSPEFKEMIAKKRSFVVPAIIFTAIWYLGFILLAGYAPDFMGERVTGGLTIGYLLALTQFVMVWVLAYAYIRRADKVFDPLAARAAEKAVEAGRKEAQR